MAWIVRTRADVSVVLIFSLSIDEKKHTETEFPLVLICDAAKTGRVTVVTSIIWYWRAGFWYWVNKWMTNTNKEMAIQAMNSNGNGNGNNETVTRIVI